MSETSKTTSATKLPQCGDSTESIRWKVGELSAMCLDTTYWPICIYTILGEMDESLAAFQCDTLIELANRAQREDVRAVLVIDSLDSGRPTPLVRNYLGERIGQMPLVIHERMIATVVAFRYAWQRGVVTALRWVHPSKFAGVYTTGTMAEALAQGIERISHVNNGDDVPTILPELYNRPVMPNFGPVDTRIAR